MSSYKSLKFHPDVKDTFIDTPFHISLTLHEHILLQAFTFIYTMNILNLMNVGKICQAKQKMS